VCKNKYIDIVQQSYLQDIIRWRYALLLLVPGLLRHIDILGRGHRVVIRCILRDLDATYSLRDKLVVAVYFSYYYEHVCVLKFVDTVDQSAREHLQCALEHRIILLYDNLFMKGSAKRKSHRQGLRGRVMLLRRLTKTAHLLPPQYQDLRRFECSILVDKKPCAQCTAPDGAPNTQDDPLRERDACFCSWIIRCLPTSYLNTFGIREKRLCMQIHESKHTYRTHTQKLAVLYYTAANQSDGAVKQLTDLYCNSIAFLLRLYFKILMTEAAVDPAIHDGAILTSFYRSLLQLVPFLAMNLSYDVILRESEQDTDRTIGYTKSTLHTWCRHQGYEKAYEDMFRELICEGIAISCKAREELDDLYEHEKSMHDNSQTYWTSNSET
jgi:hypothetical protein